jgi:hypothetical protein
MSIGKHQSAAPGTQTWLTPPHVLQALGVFDLDPCAAVGWPTARTHYVWPQDGLSLPWFGRVYLNPPYLASEIGRWLYRLADHGRGVALIFARTETEAFFSSVWNRAHGLLFLQGRLHFHLPDGTRASGNAGAPSVLVGYGAEELDCLSACQLPGQFVPLRFPRSWLFVPEESWTELVDKLLKERRRPVTLSEIYATLRRHPKAQRNRHWRAKVRQSLARAGAKRVSPSTYAVAFPPDKNGNVKQSTEI